MRAIGAYRISFLCDALVSAVHSALSPETQFVFAGSFACEAATSLVRVIHGYVAGARVLPSVSAVGDMSCAIMCGVCSICSNMLELMPCICRYNFCGRPILPSIGSAEPRCSNMFVLRYATTKYMDA